MKTKTTGTSNPSIHSPTSPTWKNWSRNIIHMPAADGMDYYFAPNNLGELKLVLEKVSKIPGATLRVSGQRHSQPPLVADDNRDAVPLATKTFLVDMACYADLGPAHDQRILLGPGKNQVTVNTGVREDELDAFLAERNLMLNTVTAGGFFSIGGMTAVDVHGATWEAPIFAEDVSAFHLLLADGTTTTIDKNLSPVAGWSPLQFARVSLGGLGIVTSVIINVLSRPFATTLKGSTKRLGIKDKSSFISQMCKLLAGNDRVETFFTPYATAWVGFPFIDAKNFLALCWNIETDPKLKIPNPSPQPYPNTACKLAGEKPPVYGAPDLGEVVEGISEELARASQYVKSPGNSPDGAFEDGLTNPAVIAAAAMEVIDSQVNKANAAHSELWLTDAARVIFMSYYVPLPDLKEAGLGKVWDGLDAVARIVTKDGNFHIAAPMEFRFVKGGNSAMSGAYTDNANTYFINLDVIGFVDEKSKSSEYPIKLLQFFADVEREWVKMGGFPHNGKIYGFYDPTAEPGTYSATGPFNPNFLADLRARRGERLVAFNNFRQQLDPKGLFYNNYLRKLLD